MNPPRRPRAGDSHVHAILHRWSLRLSSIVDRRGHVNDRFGEKRAAPTPTSPNTVTRLYYRASRLVDKVLFGLRGCFDGLCLGVLNSRITAEIDEAYYHQAREYLDAAYNRQGLWPWEAQAIERYFNGVQRIAVTSAGGGREVLALLKAGYDAVGFEPNKELRGFGSQLISELDPDDRMRPCVRDHWPTDAVGFDAAIVGWGGYMLIAGRKTRVAFLKGAAERLPTGAPVLLSFFVREVTNIRFRTVTAVAGPLRRVLRREPVEPGDVLVPNLAHYFTRDEIASELEEGGFEVVAFEVDDYGWAVGRVRNRAHIGTRDRVERTHD